MNSFLTEDDYHFKVFRNDGMSGTVYMGNPKKNKKLPKILVKNNESQFAANEFFALRIAALLDMSVPKTWFIQRENSENFNNKFVVGIEYLEGLSKATNDILDSAQTRKEFIECNLLHICFSNTDRFQTALTADGHIIPIDFAECFANSPITIFQLMSDHSAITNNAFYNYIDGIYDTVCFCKGLLNREFSITESEFDNTTKQLMQKLSNLEDEQITDIIDVIKDYYSASVAEYYRQYIDNVRIQALKFL